MDSLLGWKANLLKAEEIAWRHGLCFRACMGRAVEVYIGTLVVKSEFACLLGDIAF
jgi:hypothetical protein